MLQCYDATVHEGMIIRLPDGTLIRAVDGDESLIWVQWEPFKVFRHFSEWYVEGARIERMNYEGRKMQYTATLPVGLLGGGPICETDV